ncbi:MAG: NusG domain II-containing protein [Defluviitaleaceae bacterium]|nr:NusG domain II-containing protein [Defluviitaleaceae bacterium]
MKAKLLSAKEILLIVAILSVGFVMLALLHDSSDNLFAEISYEHGVRVVDLNSNHVFYLSSTPNVLFEVREGGVAFISSDCVDQICVRAGFQRRAGRIVACLPNRVILSVTGETDLDIFVGFK